MKTTALAVSALLALTRPAWAQGQPQAQHDKAWYAGHAAERAATLRACYSDESYAHLYDCRNAADGENMVRAADLARQSDFLADPAWWRQNSIARHGAVVTCAKETGASYPQVKPYCSLVFAVELQARK